MLVMSTPVVVLAVACLCLLGGAVLFGAFALSKRPVQVPDSSLRESVATLELKVRALERDVEQLPSIWTEERNRAARHEQRARKAEQRTEALLAASEEEPDPSLDLRERDGSGGQAGAVPPVSSDLAEHPAVRAAHQALVLGALGRNH